LLTQLDSFLDFFISFSRPTLTPPSQSRLRPLRVLALTELCVSVLPMCDTSVQADFADTVATLVRSGGPGSDDVCAECVFLVCFFGFLAIYLYFFPLKHPHSIAASRVQRAGPFGPRRRASCRGVGVVWRTPPRSHRCQGSAAAESAAAAAAAAVWRAFCPAVRWVFVRAICLW
jgi:hypothetical protein